MAVKIQYRRDTAANWTSVNPTLSDGEPGYETDTGKFKVGNGSTAWASLAYSSGIPGADGADGTDGTDGTNGVGVPAGGTAGQVLEKINGTDYNTQWIEPRDCCTRAIMFDDFTGATYHGSLGHVVSEHNWMTALAYNGAINTNPTSVTSDGNHIGVVELSTGTGNNGCSGMNTGIYGTGRVKVWTIGSGEVTFESIFYVPTLSDVTDRYVIKTGLCDAAAWVNGNDEIAVYYQEAVSPNWRYRTESGGSETYTSSSVAVTTGWHHAKIVANAAGNSVEFFMDGVSLGTTTTNIPTGTSKRLAPEFSIYKTSGTLARVTGLDLIKVKSVFSTPR